MPQHSLWKQLLGALAGAIIAFVLYEGYVLVSSDLQAITAL